MLGINRLIGKHLFPNVVGIHGLQKFCFDAYLMLYVCRLLAYWTRLSYDCKISFLLDNERQSTLAMLKLSKHFIKSLLLNSLPPRVPIDTQRHNFVNIWWISMNSFCHKICLVKICSLKTVTPSYQRHGWPPPPPQVFSYFFEMQMECKTCFKRSYALRAAKRAIV